MATGPGRGVDVDWKNINEKKPICHTEMADALIFSSSVSPSPEDDASALERSASPSVSQGTDSISDCISYQSQDEVMSRDNFLISDDGESIDSGTAQEIRISLQEIDDDRHCAMGYKPALRWALMGMSEH